MKKIIKAYKETYPKNLDLKVGRNFLIGDRVKAYFEKKWYSGVVIDKYFKKDKIEKVPYILVKTDERVGETPDFLLNGFGLEGRVDNLRTIFEWENEKIWGDAMYHEEIEWEMSEEEKKEWDNLPF